MFPVKPKFGNWSLESWDELTGKTWQGSGFRAGFSQHPGLDPHGCNRQIHGGSFI